MTKRMLIDATHAEETRVVVADGNQLVEFDYETSTKKQLKGNIYLAKVTRVEPSLQAAFVEFGGNRHGFLSFNEVHPDYYRIPVEDREALLAETREAADAEENEDEENATEGDSVEVLDGDDADEIQELGDATRQRLRSRTRQYKIQEVIKRNQILLVQVVKEERGNKGAALTTYLSLPGRYCVLMPNTARGGGISRKVSNPAERKQMKAILSDLDVPDGMAVIMRTAGVGRSRAEIRRDYEYLRRLWDEIRELTLKSSAPELIYEEGDVIKRSLRDSYNRDIDEVLIEGEEAYKAAKALMKTMIPSHAKRVQRYAEADQPLFNRYKIEAQLDEIYETVVTLKSGGYLVINPTEALVAIDVNSGRATRQRNIESTARQTNLEAAEEIARQLRLRDLAGLIVIDFIDMDENRNNAAVERRMKEAMKTDRARIQIGRISPFGLLELSRQRLRPSLTEASSQVCPMCAGSGNVRSTESTALRILRAIEDEGIRRRASELKIAAPTAVALYLLNEKRHALNEIEARYGFRLFVNADNDLVPPDFNIERVDGAAGGEREEARPAADEEERGGKRRRRGRRRRDEDTAEETVTADAEAKTDDSDAVAAEATDGKRDEEGGDDTSARRRGGRRGGRRRRRSDDNAVETADQETAAEEESETVDASASDTGSPDEADATEEEKPRRTRRGRRGRRRTSEENGSEATAPAEASGQEPAVSEDPADGSAAEESAEKPKRRRRPRRPRAEQKPAVASDDANNESVAAEGEQTPIGNVSEDIAATAPADEDRGDIAVAVIEPASINGSDTAADDAPPSDEPAFEAPVSPAVVPVATASSGKDVGDEDEGGDADGGEIANEAPAAVIEVVEPAAPRPQRRGWWNRVVG